MVANSMVECSGIQGGRLVVFSTVAPEVASRVGSTS